MISLRNISLNTILLLPLCSIDGEKYTDYLDESINIEYASLDINKPWMTKNFFIIIDVLSDNKANYLKLSDKVNFLSKYLYPLDGVYKNIYAFNIDSDFKDDLELIRMSNYKSMSNEAKMRILSFWGSDNSGALLDLLFSDKDNTDKFSDIEIKEQDEEEEWVDRLV